MITRRVRVQLALFVVIALLGSAYVGFSYAGLGRYVHDDGYRVTLELPEAGGLFANGEVTYNGVAVGRVRSLRLTDDGIEATLAIDGGAPRIPADLDAVVANRSAIGEQYLDLRPRTDAAPYLAAGDVIPADRTTLPPKVEAVLRDSRDFAASVPIDDLRTVVDELYDATNGSAGPLRQLLSTSTDLLETADKNLPATRSLIDSSATVLATQERSADSIRSFSRDLRLFAGGLRGTDRDFRRLLAVTPDAALEVDRLFATVGRPLGVVMSNLVSTAQVFGTNARGVRSVLVQLPDVVDAGYAVTAGDGIRVGAVLSLFQPLPCTSGYEDTPLRPGLDTTPGQPLDRDVRCTDPPTGRVAVTTPSELSDLMGGTTR